MWSLSSLVVLCENVSFSMVDMSELQEFVFYQNFAFSQINHEVVFDAGRNPCYLLVL